ncbi:MAG: DUF309 domain-containing protein [Chlorobiota bacterium]|jgi:predicted metal-dependent hydrolase|nr:DUF309 domain-containing protein [Chlorobiota bacterium]QQS65936.1 MAG: DUF309 domain-containing protein [Chlorobiota bacterium]
MSNDSKKSFQSQYELGLNEFNSGKFFESHDTLEDLWMEVRGEKRKFFQGLIQISVGMFHYIHGNFTGGENQLVRGIEKLNEYMQSGEEIYLGIDLKSLIKQLSDNRISIRKCIQEGDNPHKYDNLPLIKYSPNKDVEEFFEKNF